MFSFNSESSQDILRDHIKNVNAVKMYARLPSGSIACAVSNGGCDQICLPKGHDRQCACTTGMKVQNFT